MLGNLQSQVTIWLAALGMIVYAAIFPCFGVNLNKYFVYISIVLWARVIVIHGTGIYTTFMTPGLV